jgi:hypothetical protein
LLVCRDKFNLSPLDYSAIQYHFELFNLSNYDNFDMLCISQLIDVAIDSFNSIVAKDGIVLNLTGLYGLDSLPTYLEKWFMQLWDLAFSAIFKGVSPFKKNDVFIDYYGATHLVKKMIYR